MNIYAASSLLVFVIDICMGIYVIRRNPKEALSRVFLCMTCALAIWAFAYSFVYPAANLADKDFIWFWYRVAALGWCTVPSIYLHFALTLSQQDYWFKKWWFRLLVYLPAVIFTYQAFTGILLVVDFKAVANYTVEIMQTDTLWYVANMAWYLLYMTIAFTVIALWGKRSTDKRVKKQTRIILSTGIFTTAVGIAINFISPLFSVELPATAPIVGIVWAFGMWYAISKYQLMQLSVAIAAEEILTNMVNILILVDSEGKITKSNLQAQRILGYTEKQLKSQKASLIVVESGRIEEMLINMMEGIEHHMQYDVSCKTCDGVEIPMRLFASAIIDELRGLLGSVMIFQDLRETRQLQKEIIERCKAENALLEANQQLSAFSSILEEQNHQLEAQNVELEAMSNNVMEINRVLADKNIELSNILDNVGQGFLSFGRDLTVNAGYSLECINIFHQAPDGKKIASLLYPQDMQEYILLEEIFKRIFNATAGYKIDIYLSLLPEEIHIFDRYIKIEYSIGRQLERNSIDYIIMILTDITDKRSLEQEREREKQIFKMLVKVIVNHDDFLMSIEDYCSFYLDRINQYTMNSLSSKELVAAIFREAHTFKGDFSQFDTVNIPHNLHEIESQLSNIVNNCNECSGEELAHAIKQIDFADCLKEDMQIIKDHLGEDFLTKEDVVTLEKSRLLNIEAKLSSKLNEDQWQLLLADIRSLKYQSFKGMFTLYPEYVEKMAASMGKWIRPFSVEGSDILVDTSYYYAFVKSLVHVFRNIVDHGIETMEERLLQGKDEMAIVSCLIQSYSDVIRITITDDGAGIDLETIRTRAVQEGIHSEQEAINLSTSDLISLIFIDEFSSREDVSILSGRGLGLAAVKNELDKIHGKIEVKTIAGKGTSMVFYLPWAEA